MCFFAKAEFMKFAVAPLSRSNRDSMILFLPVTLAVMGVCKIIDCLSISAIVTVEIVSDSDIDTGRLSKNPISSFPLLLFLLPITSVFLLHPCRT